MTTSADVEVYLDERGGPPVRVGVLRPSFQGAHNLASSSFQYDPAYLADSARSIFSLAYQTTHGLAPFVFGNQVLSHG